MMNQTQSKSIDKNSLQIIQDTLARLLPDIKQQETALKNIAAGVKTKKINLVQFGNTVFMIRPTAPKSIEFHAFSNEPVSKMKDAFMGLYKMAKNQGIKHASTYADRPGYEKIGQELGLPVNISQSTRMKNGVMVPVFQFNLDL